MQRTGHVGRRLRDHERLLALIRLRRLLAALDPDDRAYIVECLAEIVAEIR